MGRRREKKGRKVENDLKRVWTGLFQLIVIAALLSSFGGCTSAPYWPRQKAEPRSAPRPEARVRPAPAKKTALMGFTIQAGAFSRVENAARMTEALRLQGLDAYYFVHSSGLYKVRFGNFTAKAQARERAETLRKASVIAEYYIVKPDEYSVARRPSLGDDYLREQLIKTARSFLGVPYLWGGTSPENGFDCSGLVMAVYQLNGLDLPRTSRDQFEAGTPVDPDSMKKGDLVFFANGNGAPISHVGIYIGDGQFIHAPATGKKIRVESLSCDYYAKRFAGVRTYL